MDLGSSLENLPTLLDQYIDDLSSYADNLDMNGKTLEKSLREQATWSAYYGERASELKIILKYLEIQVKRVRGKLFVQYNENYSKALGERVIEKYIDRDDDFLDMNDLVLEVQEVLDKYLNVLEAFKTRGYALRNITEARVAEMSQVTL
jgi:hypothetical protein